MNFLLKIVSVFFLLVISAPVYGQHGEVDITFLPYDTSGFQTIEGAPNYTVYKSLLQADGKVLVGGEFTQYKDRPAKYLTRLLASGKPDLSFQQNQIDPSSGIRALALQTNGKILVGGDFDTWNGAPASVVRLNQDGTRDNSFNLPANLNGTVTDIAVMSDGKIVIVGSFTSIGASSAPRIIRLLPNGAVDNTFNTGTGANNFVSSIAALATGELFVAGFFTTFNGTTVGGYVKLENDGSISPTFLINQFSATFNKVLVQPDGKVLFVKGSEVYRTLSDGSIDPAYTVSAPVGFARGATLLSNGKLLLYGHSYVKIRNADGSIDPGFNATIYGGDLEIYSGMQLPNGNLLIGGNFVTLNQEVTKNIAVVDLTGNITPNPMGFNSYVQTIDIQSDNKILVGGSLLGYMGINTSYFCRLFPNGEPDTAFMNNLGSGFDFNVRDSYILPDGRILVSGDFGQVNGYAYSRIARLFADGSVDTSFHPPTFDSSINSIDLQSDGKILVAGTFSYVNGQARCYIARLHPNGQLDNTMSSPLYSNVVFAMGANRVVVAPDGKIFVAGRFACCSPIVKLLPNGAIDNSFYMNTTTYNLYDLVILPDGKIIIGGVWSSYGGHSVQILDRLYPNGNVDPSFHRIDGGSSGYTDNAVKKLLKVSANQIVVAGSFLDPTSSILRDCFIVSADGIRDTVFDVKESFSQSGNVSDLQGVGLQSDGRLIIGGRFTTIGDFRRNRIARLYRSDWMSDTICSGGNYSFADQNLVNPGSGLYTGTYQSSIGTDSTVILNLSVTSLNTGILQNGSTLSSSCTSCSHQWLECTGNGFTVIPGATNASFTPAVTGSYALLVAQNSCSDTSACINFNLSGLGLNELNEQEFYILPNPATDRISISGLKDFSQYEIINSQGSSVLSGEMKNNSIDIQSLTPGFYLVRISGNTSRFIKQ